MPLSAYAKDAFVAPHMSAFTAADIPGMSACDPQQEHWVSNFIPNTLLRANVRAPERQYMFNFLRRAEAAFREYGLARERTLSFLCREASPSSYLAAISHWEVFLSQAWHAYQLLGGLAGLDPRKGYFIRGDGSVLERLNQLYNRSKHTESRIGRQQIPDGDTLCVWLDNDGLRSPASTDGSEPESYLTFGEMAHDVLEGDLAKWANWLQDPLTLPDNVKSYVSSARNDI